MILSIIIPCFNEKNTIKQIVLAVKNSSYKHQEIIIVDDFSNDGTREILQQEIEPLVDIPEPRSRRGKKERARQEQSMGRFVEKASASEAGVMSDHPILKRKRVQRDLSQVIFGPTQ